MKKALAISLFLSLAFAISITMKVGAQDNGTDLNLTSFDDALADKLSISKFAGGILATLIVTLAFTLPTAIYTRTIIPPLFVGFLCLCFSVAVGWLDVWPLLLLALLSSLLFAGKMSKIITGGGEK